MQRIEVKRINFLETSKAPDDIPTSSRNVNLEKYLMKVLPNDGSGNIIYDGPGQASQRTGSPIRLLIDWALYRKGTEKPIDELIFKDVIKNLGIDTCNHNDILSGKKKRF